MERQAVLVQKVYLDNCCYNRPFDDRSNIKNYLEREAVLIVMQMAFNRDFEIIGSEVLKKEMLMISDIVKRNNVETLYKELKSKEIGLEPVIICRAEEIVKSSSIKAFDSLHLACAEYGADVLLTTDMKLLKAAKKLNVNVKVQNPVEFVLEVSSSEHDDEFDEK